MNLTDSACGKDIFLTQTNCVTAVEKNNGARPCAEVTEKFINNSIT